RGARFCQTPAPGLEPLAQASRESVSGPAPRLSSSWRSRLLIAFMRSLPAMVVSGGSSGRWHTAHFPAAMLQHQEHEQDSQPDGRDRVAIKIEVSSPMDPGTALEMQCQ